MTNIYTETLCPAFPIGFGNFVGMFFLPITYFKYFFHVKNQLFVTLKSDKVWIRIETKSWIRNWIWIGNETNADPQQRAFNTHDHRVAVVSDIHTWLGTV